MARALKPMDDDDYEQPDLAPFRATGEAFELHAYPACRAIMAVAAAMDPDQPVLQVELHQRGAVFVGTDRWSYLTAYVPYPRDAASYLDLEGLADDWPEPTDIPLSVLTCMDPLGLCTKWAKDYAKPKRAKEAPTERISIQVGTRVDEAQPTLSEDLDPQAVRFAGPDTTCMVSRIDVAFEWQPSAMPDWAKPAPQGWTRMAGWRLAQLGRLAALDPEGVLATRTKVIRTGGWVVEVATRGYPEVRGHVMAIKPTT